MHNGAPCSIHAIAYELGELRDIAEIDEVQQEPEMLEILRTGGLQCYSTTPLLPIDLAERCLRQTLDRCGASPSGIEALVYASESPWSESLYARLNAMLTTLGLRGAYPIGVSLSGCTNFSLAIRVASTLIRAEGLERVLVVCADKAPVGARRTMRPGVCVFSDGALSCVVGRSGAGEFDVLRIVHENAPEMGEFNLERDAATLVIQISSGVRKAVQAALGPLDKQPSDIPRVFLGNFARHISMMYAGLCGFRDDQCYLENIPRFAHTYVGDALINLHDSHRRTPMAPGELCVLFGIAVTSWGVMVLQKT